MKKIVNRKSWLMPKHKKIWSISSRRMRCCIVLDFTFLEKSSDGRENVLVLTDVFTKFTQAIPTRDQKATTVAKVLVKDWFLKLGIPKRLQSDHFRHFIMKKIVNRKSWLMPKHKKIWSISSRRMWCCIVHEC
jgi:AAA+ ATPase superfamily predicted ATPase